MEEAISIKCFEVSKNVKNAFNVRRTDIQTGIYQKKYNINWESNDHYELSTTLNQQIYNEFIDIHILKMQCEDEDDKLFVFRLNNKSKEFFDYRSYNLQPKEQKEGCNKFLKYYKDYTEIFSRDQDALSQYKFDVKIYAVVLLLNNIYQGHIYAWQSPNNKDYCFAMGIRNKIDTIFTKYEKSDLKNVSSYLLEGVRRLTLSLGSIFTVITHPRPIMKIILPKLGFVETDVEEYLLGNGITQKIIKDSTYYILKDMLTPIILNDINFIKV